MKIAVAGSTGNLGMRIVRELRRSQADVIALVHAKSSSQKVAQLKKYGATLQEVNFRDSRTIASACEGCDCVVSAMLGLFEVMVGMQTVVLQGSIEAGVPRFIPSDYSIDFTKLAYGGNRNLDLHKKFQERVDAVHDSGRISATSILNGMFMDLLTGQAPLIQFKLKRVLYWGNQDQQLEFTAIHDTAAYTARAALDGSTPRFLKVVGESASAKQIAELMSAISGAKFMTRWAGNLPMLRAMATGMRTVMPAPNAVFPPWQGMQYFHDMFSGKALMQDLDNDRYSDFHWTQLREMLQQVQ